MTGMRAALALCLSSAVRRAARTARGPRPEEFPGSKLMKSISTSAMPAGFWRLRMSVIELCSLRGTEAIDVPARMRRRPVVEHKINLQSVEKFAGWPVKGRLLRILLPVAKPILQRGLSRHSEWATIRPYNSSRHERRAFAFIQSNVQ